MRPQKSGSIAGRETTGYVWRKKARQLLVQFFGRLELNTTSDLLRANLEQGANFREQMARRTRLADKIIGAGIESMRLIDRRVTARDEDNGRANGLKLGSEGAA